MNELEKVAITSFYSFVEIAEPELLLPKILLVGKKKYIKGTVLLAEEGFNGSLSGRKEDVDFVIDRIIELTGASDVSRKTNYDDLHPFRKLKVKLKPEIVSLRAGKIDVQKLKGEYIDPKDWDDFIQRDDVILIDTRNDYEIEEGTFKGAIDPKTDTFRQFPDWVEKNKTILEGKKIAMVCTGGIRCEKSTAYMKSIGYEDVYHIKGGILQYLEDTGNRDGVWEGTCFVFDDRRLVDDELAPVKRL